MCVCGGGGVYDFLSTVYLLTIRNVSAVASGGVCMHAWVALTALPIPHFVIEYTQYAHNHNYLCHLISCNFTSIHICLVATKYM